MHKLLKFSNNKSPFKIGIYLNIKKITVFFSILTHENQDFSMLGQDQWNTIRQEFRVNFHTSRRDKKFELIYL